MKYFIRYTEDANQDLERKSSFHNSDYKVGVVANWREEDNRTEAEILSKMWNCEIEDVVILDNFYYSQKLAGLCAFELDAETEKDAIEEAKEHNFNSVYNTVNFTSFAVFCGNFIDDCPEGCVFYPSKIIYENKVFE